MSYITLKEDDLIGASIFKDYHLTALMTDKHKSKNLIRSTLSYPIHLMLNRVLNPYGIRITGGTMLGDYQVKAISIDRYFPPKNERIIRQLYAFNGGVIHIMFSGAGDCAYDITYDIETMKCAVNKLVHGSTTFSKEYASLNQLMNDVLERSMNLPEEKLFWDEILKEKSHA